ncbi:hypothetical protein [Photobacterium sp. GSS17]|uniref:hypothetical protein n=1 Tax=Photobacterium sp. GSS17 TaxID=3020715 RepID=UPI00236187BC|nr:hypothetical protein [Photobacterium sp. GSS17]
MNYYPELKDYDVEVLRKARIIVENLLQNPDYLNDKSCTYAPEAKLLLESFIISEATKVSQETKETATQTPEEFNLLDTSLEVIRELQQIKGSLKNLSTNEKIATYRLLVTQLEKVTELMRQAEDIEHYKTFKTVLFDTLERHLNPAQISEFIEDFQLELKDRKKV